MVVCAQTPAVEAPRDDDVRTPRGSGYALMLRGLAMVAAALAVALALYVRSSAAPRGAWDDLAVLRASAWLATCSSTDPLPTRAREHLEQHSAALTNVRLTRYRLRTEFSSNYGLIAPLVRALDRAGKTPALGNVILACRVQHLLVLLAVLALAWRRQHWVFLTLALAALTVARAWPGNLSEWLPFQRHNMTWSTPAPRGAAVLAWFGAIVAWLSVSGTRRYLVSGVFALGSLLCHRSMALLCLAATVPPLGLSALLARWLRAPPSFRLIAAGFCLMAVAAAAGKLGLLWYAGGHFPVLFTASGTGRGGEVWTAGAMLVVWAVLILAALGLWSRARAARADAQLIVVGDGLAMLLAASGAVAVGLNIAHPPLELWYRSLFVPAEASMRLGAMPQLLFFAVLALALVTRAPRWLTPALLGCAVLGSALALLVLQRSKVRRLPEQAQTFEQLLRKGHRAYENEPQYYLSLAGEVARRGCGAPSELEAIDQK